MLLAHLLLWELEGIGGRGNVEILHLTLQLLVLLREGLLLGYHAHVDILLVGSSDLLLLLLEHFDLLSESKLFHWMAMMVSSQTWQENGVERG